MVEYKEMERECLRWAFSSKKNFCRVSPSPPFFERESWRGEPRDPKSQGAGVKVSKQGCGSRWSGAKLVAVLEKLPGPARRSGGDREDRGRGLVPRKKLVVEGAEPRTTTSMLEGS